MITWFCESPWPGAAVGVTLAVMLVSGYLQTGRRMLLVGAGLCLLLGALLALIERQVVTDRERVTAIIYDLADALVEQREGDVLDAIHPFSVDVRRRADSELRLYVFQRVDVKRNLRVEVDYNHQPPQVTARFNVVAEVQRFPRPIPRFVELEFTRDDQGQWKIRDYRHAKPQEGFLKRTE